MSGLTPEKHRQTGRGSGRSSRGQTVGKCHVVGDKVMGTIKGLHYKEKIWKAMSIEQKDKMVELCKATRAELVVKAATTTTAGTIWIGRVGPAADVDSCGSVSGFQQR